MIPSRYSSVRYPGKPLAAISQPDGSEKTLIQMSWETACGVSGVSEVHIVTDDDRIRIVAEGFGASVIMTKPERENGTARCAEAIEISSIEADLVVNLQGDAPLTPNWFIEDLIAAMANDPIAQVATPVIQCDQLTYNHFVEDRMVGRVGGTTVVFDNLGNALYFSKEVLPYIAPGKTLAKNPPVFQHIGVYAYRPEALRSYLSWPISQLETLEGLEQLRFLVNAIPVRCVIVKGRGRFIWELNNPEDVARIESALKDFTR